MMIYVVLGLLLLVLAAAAVLASWLYLVRRTCRELVRDIRAGQYTYPEAVIDKLDIGLRDVMVVFDYRGKVRIACMQTEEEYGLAEANISAAFGPALRGYRLDFDARGVAKLIGYIPE